MTKLLSSVAFGALLVASGAAYAADPAAPIVDDVAATSAFSGLVEVGGIVRNATELEDGIVEDETTIGGAYGAFALWGQFDNLRLGVDGYVEGMAFDDIAENVTLTPKGLGVLGAHVGLDLGTGYVGAFGALGVYPNRWNEETLTGYTAGLEGTVQFDALTLFGKIGHAFAPAEDYDTSINDLEGFVGTFGEAGLVYALSDDLAVKASAGFGYSPDFDQTGDEGSYVNVGAKVAYRLPTEFNLNLVASYDAYRAFMDNSREETVEHTFKLGLSIPFGDGGTAASVLNPLATTVAPFRAGYSSDAL
jgi:hypothetical protein